MLRFFTVYHWRRDRRLYESKSVVRIIRGWLKHKGKPKLCAGSLGRSVSSEGREPLNRILYKTTRSQTGYAKLACVRPGLRRQFETHSKWSRRFGFSSDA